MSKKAVLAGALIGLYTGGLSAQSAPTGYELHYYNAGATSPFQIESLPPGSYSCNQDQPVSSLTSNPQGAYWNDPEANGRFCVWQETAGGPLFALPVGNYEATLVAINSYGASPESNRAPFVRGMTPGAPTNLRLAR